MADGLDIVAVRILHESAVVVGVILGPEAGLAVVRAAGGQRGLVKFLHTSAVLRREREMHRPTRLASFHPQGGRILGAEAHYSVCVVLHGESKWRQRGGVETLARVDVLHLQHDVIKHDCFSFSGIFRTNVPKTMTKTVIEIATPMSRVHLRYALC